MPSKNNEDIRRKVFTISSNNDVRIVNKKTRPHRALILQGGGALGAYEAGVFKALYEKLIEEDTKRGHKERPLFDIIAGSSIGAVNAAILVNYVVKNKTWINSYKILDQLWDELSDPTWWASTMPGLRDNPFFAVWRNYFKENILDNRFLSSQWDYWKKIREMCNDIFRVWNEVFIQSNIYQFVLPVFYLKEEFPYFDVTTLKGDKWKEERPWIAGYFWWPENVGPLASGETARRYFSYLSSLQFGIPNVLAPAIIQPDWKFLNFWAPPFFRFANTPLEKMIAKYWYDKEHPDKPLQTDYDKGQPRLLLVSVDVQNFTGAVTFDSYTKYNGKCRTEYEDNSVKYIMEYDGITIDHINASMSTHQRYKYPAFTALEIKKNCDSGAEEGKTVTKRYLWDGAYLSNTPLREVIQLHRDYWHKIKKSVEVPDLEIYIVNLYPSTEKSLKDAIGDADTIRDREIDIKFHDRTTYDLKSANLTADYIDLVNEIMSLAISHAKDKSALQVDLQAILNSKTISRSRSNEKRKYQDLLDGRFSIEKVVYVERSDDGNTIFGKAFEFSTKTVEDLRVAGYKDALNSFKKMENCI